MAVVGELVVNLLGNNAPLTAAIAKRALSARRADDGLLGAVKS